MKKRFLIVLILAISIVFVVHTGLDKSTEVIEIQNILTGSTLLRQRFGQIREVKFLRSGSKITRTGSGKISGRFFFLIKSSLDNHNVQVTWSRANSLAPIEGVVAIEGDREMKLGE